MTEIGRAEQAAADLDRLGLKYFVDVRATARRLLSAMRSAQRTAFAAAVTERLLREAEQRPPGETPGYLATWRPVLDTVWRGLAADPAARRQIAVAVGQFYLSPRFHERRHDDPADADDHAVMAALYTAECFLHGCLDFAAWTGWRGFDAATLRAAADRQWPHRRPAEISPYAWELAHPVVQAELDQQLADLELLGIDGRTLLDRPAAGQAVIKRLRGD